MATPNLNSSVTVIIVAYRGERWLSACLKSLRTASDNIKLVLVDNGDGNGIDRLSLDEFDCVLLKPAHVMGFAEANNFALTSCPPRTSAVCFLNQDTISEPGWLARCVEVLERQLEIGAVSPLMRTYDGNGWDEAFVSCAKVNAGAVTMMGVGAAAGWPALFYKTRSVTGAAMVVRSDVLRRTGPFDPIFGSYYEDFDLCMRVRNAGYLVGICGAGTVRHFGGSSTTTPKAVRRRMGQIIRNQAILSFREAGQQRWRTALSYLCSSAPRNLIRGLLRTGSSQPILVQLRAYGELLRLTPRLISCWRDERAWREYLETIGWAGAELCEPMSKETVYSAVRAAD